MISILAGRRVQKNRRSILQGVYEENLWILGRHRSNLSRGRHSMRKPLLFYLVACLSAFLIHSEYRGTSSEVVEKSSPSPKPHTDPLYPPIAYAASVGKDNVAELKSLARSGNVSISRMLGLSVKRIVVDAGHGGTDLGTIGKLGTLEKDITLDIAKRLRACLTDSGLSQIFMTRSDDSLMPLQERVAFARHANADLLISIHINWLPNTPLNIVETFYFGPSTDQRTLRLAEQENKGSEYGMSDFREIVERLGRVLKLQESKKLAESIQENLSLNSKEHNPNIKNNGVKRAPFVVLLGLDVPSVLVEVSCLSNGREERDLNSERHRENIARYLAAGIETYLNAGALKNDIKP